MPQFDTGSGQWDQGLNSLSNILFPDPSKIAAAGLAGAQTRESLLRAKILQDQVDALKEQEANPHPWAGTGPGPIYGTPGPDFAPLPQPAGPWPRTTAGVQPPAPTPSVPAPAAGPAPAPGPNTPLSTTPGITPPSAPPATGPAPTYQPGTAVAVGTAVANQLAQGGGPPPPTSSTAPGEGAPAATNATGNNGGLPPRSPEGTGIHTASVLPADQGGQVNAPPAAHDGSPAPPIDLAGVMTRIMRLPNMDAAKAQDMMISYINEAYQHHMIAPQTYETLMSTYGATGPLSAHMTLAQQGIVTGADVGQRNREFMLGMINVIDKDGNITQVTRQDYLANKDRYRPVDPQVAATSYGMKPFFPVDPKTGQPDQTRTIMLPAIVGSQQGLMPVPEGYQPIAKDTTGAAEESRTRDYLLDQKIQNIYQPPGPSWGDATTLRQPAGLSPAAQAAVNERAQEHMKDQDLRGDPNNFPVAQDRAIADLQREGRLQTPEQIMRARQRDISTMHITDTDPALMDGTDLMHNKPQKRFRIDLIDPATHQPVATPGGAPAQGAAATPGAPVQGPAATPGPVSNVFAPKGKAAAPAPTTLRFHAIAPTAPAPAQAGGPAQTPQPASTIFTTKEPDGTTKVDAQGNLWVAHGGQMQRATPAEIQSFRQMQSRVQAASPQPGGAQ